MSTILIVDDDPVQCRHMADLLSRMGHMAIGAASAKEGLSVIARRNPAVDLVVLELGGEETDGFAFLQAMGRRSDGVPVIAAVAPGAAAAVAQAMQQGAVDFIVRPCEAARLRVSVNNALRLRALTHEVRRTQVHTRPVPRPGELIAGDPAMARVLSLAAKAARAVWPVLIEGEAGAGKETLARFIHAGGERRARPFVALRCHAVGMDAFEQGIFERKRAKAAGGTLYLDGIDSLPARSQDEVLQAIAEADGGGARRSARPEPRLIVSTRASLLDCVRNGSFREDLYYRLGVMPVTVPPLRLRKGDIPALVAQFVTRFSASEGKVVRAVTPEALALLQEQEWPGNVTELENIVFRAMVLAGRDHLDVDDFPQIAPRQPATAPASRAATEGGAAQRLDAQFSLQAEGSAFQAMPVSDLPSRNLPRAVTLVDDDGEVRPLEELEADVIRFAIRHYQGRMSEVSRRLGIGRSTLYRKLKDFCFDEEHVSVEDDSLQTGLKQPVSARQVA